jgi:hypothetical protein
MALIDDVKNMVLFSFSLDPERKEKLVAALPSLNEEQLTQLKRIFTDEESKKNEIIAKAVENDPTLAEKIERIVRDGVGHMYKDIEKSESPLEDKEAESILKKLE